MDAQDWGVHHAAWHGARLWEFLGLVGRDYITRIAGGPAPRQEGTPGNGLDFLAMHRVMLRMLKQNFPAHVNLFQGWAQLPVDPDDPNDPVPQNQTARPFSGTMLEAKEVVENQIVTFKNDDELGLFIQSKLRPTQADPRNTSNDPRTGIHGYLHDRFHDDASDINMTRFDVNIKNQRFWRLHGWIDSRWQAYRDACSLSENDPVYVAALREQRDHMAGHGMPSHDHHRNDSKPAAMDKVIPHDLKNLFSVQRGF
jgi:hypothetical protein